MFFLFCLHRSLNRPIASPSSYIFFRPSQSGERAVSRASRKAIFIRKRRIQLRVKSRAAVSGTTCRLAHLPRCIILEQSVGVGASNARCYRYCSFCCSFPLFLSLPITLAGPLAFSYAVHTCDALFSFRAIGPTRGESITVLVRSTISLHF